MTKPTLHKFTEGFESAALNYQIGRPSYPKKAIDYLVETFKLTAESEICDLAAGTGKFTAPLAKHSGARVTGVEPVSPMREEFEKALPRVPVIDGAAEKIPFEQGKFDLVTVAQAFHWFDIPKAQKEIRRVLKTRGGLAIIWNHREALDWAKKVDGIIHSHYKNHPYEKAIDWQAKFAQSKLFEQPLQTYSVRHSVRYTPEKLLRCVFSVSAIALLKEKERAHVRRQVEHLFRSHPDLKGKDHFVLPHHVKIYWTRAV